MSQYRDLKKKIEYKNDRAFSNSPIPTYMSYKWAHLDTSK